MCVSGVDKNILILFCYSQEEYQKSGKTLETVEANSHADFPKSRCWKKTRKHQKREGMQLTEININFFLAKLPLKGVNISGVYRPDDLNTPTTLAFPNTSTLFIYQMVCAVKFTRDGLGDADVLSTFWRWMSKCIVGEILPTFTICTRKRDPVSPRWTRRTYLNKRLWSAVVPLQH